jgi:hypothetical protein
MPGTTTLASAHGDVTRCFGALESTPQLCVGEGGGPRQPPPTLEYSVRVLAPSDEEVLL